MWTEESKQPLSRKQEQIFKLMFHIEWQNSFVWWVAVFTSKAEELSIENYP